MSETGFGSLTYNPAPEYADYGFGTPTPVALEQGIEAIRGVDTGFGSPFAPSEGPTLIFAEGDLIPDDGGVVIRVCRDWRGSFGEGRDIGPLGPFTVKIIADSTGLEYASVGDFAGVCFTNFYQDSLPFTVPPLPHGGYGLQITWQDGLQQLTVANAFTVGPRPRCENAYSLRQFIPGWLNKGPQEVQLDQDNESVSNIAIFTKAIGEMFQNFYGRPSTATTAELTHGDTTISLESTIGFPESGAVFIEGIRFTYTGKTVTTLTGVAADHFFLDPMPTLRKVVLDVATA